MRGEKSHVSGSKTPNGEPHATAGPIQREPARKLKPGPGLAPSVVFADQRRRLHAAMIELAVEEGFRGVTVRALSRRSGVSTRTFYRHFRDTADCLGFVCESTLICALRRMEGASSQAADWKEALRKTVASMMRSFACEPDAAEVALFEAVSGGSLVLGRINANIGTIEQLFADQLSVALPLAASPRRLASGMVAGALRIATMTTLTGRADDLPDLASDLSEWMLSLTLGPGNEASPLVNPRLVRSVRREPRPLPDRGSLETKPSVGAERDRIIRATVRLAAGDGVSGLTIPGIRSAAGVSRRAFDSHFESVNVCFLESVEWLARSAAARARDWARDEPNRPQRTAKLLLALCAQAARNEALAELVFTGTLGVGRTGLMSRERLVTVAVAHIRDDHLLPDTTPTLALHASVAAAWQIAKAEVAAGKTRRLPELAPLLAHLILAPGWAMEADLDGRGRDRQH